MSVSIVEFRGERLPTKYEAPVSGSDRSAEAMRRLRHPFDLDPGKAPVTRR